MEGSRSVFTYKTISPQRPGKYGGTKASAPKKRSLRKILSLLCLFFVICGIITGAIRMQLQVFRELPDVSKVKDMTFSQATIITDRNGVELYKLFEQNREYVDISNISQHMINAIVAIEDQRYREHEGLDPWGIFRAAITRKGGASTLPQQLMTNVFNLKAGVGASFTKRVAYKFRQIVLSKRLNTTLQKQIKAEKPGLSNAEIKREMKLKVLELYLNYIELGNNSFGIEAAAKAYFGVSASELSVLQSAILASLPKSPTLYSPLKEEGKKNLMGYFTITDTSGKSYPFEGNLKQESLAKFTDAIRTADFSNKKGDNASTKFLVGLGSFSIVSEGKEYYIKYINGRKDVVISRMFDDGYLSDAELKQAYIDGVDMTFQSTAFPIKAPHFVFWIKEQLEKQYGTEAVLKGGMVVKTTLDYTIQKKAEEAFKANERTLYANGATNSSMLYLDTNNGDVLAYIGSLDYFNDEIQGQNDMVRKPRQSGSSIKPLLYALGFQKLPLTLDTPIYDIPFQVGPDRPNNADDKFEGLLPIKYALGHSRNIPSVKLFEAIGGEEVVKPYFQQLGLSGILTNRDYGYPLALGAGEVTMLELAEAYAYLTTSTPADLNPILEITSADGFLIYQKEVKEKEKDLIPDGVKYLMRKILSDPNSRLAGWVSKFNVAGLTYALKTGTSNVKTDKGNRPRDGWLAAYTPDNLILMRAGNANATPMNANAFGGTIHADPIKQLLKGLLDENYLTNKEMTNVDTATLTISKLTGKLSVADTPVELQVSTMGYAQSLPTTSEGLITPVEYDASCLGLASPLTPTAELKRGYVVEHLTSFMPNQRDVADIQYYFEESARAIPQNTGYKTALSPFSILREYPKEYCENRSLVINESIAITILTPQDTWKISLKPELMYSIKSADNLEKIVALIDEKPVFTKNILGDSKEEFSTTILNLSGMTAGKHDLTVQAMTSVGTMNRATVSITIQDTDKDPPYFVPEQSKMTETATGKEVKLIFNDHLSALAGGTVSANGEKMLDFSSRVVNFATTATTVDVVVKDAYDNVLKQTIDLMSL